jgi:hypothetical protein
MVLRRKSKKTGPRTYHPDSMNFKLTNRRGPVFLVVMFCLSTMSSFGALSPEEQVTAAKLFSEFRPYSLERIRTFSAKERNLMMEVLRIQLDKQGKPRNESVYPDIIFDMAVLGDDWAIKEYVKYFLTYRARSEPIDMRLICSPKTIPLIGEALFREEKYELRGDVGFSPTQSTVAEVMVHTLSNSTEFNQDVINWARGINHKYTMKMIRDWYRENEARLKAWDFKAVQPGAEPPEGKHPSSVKLQSTTALIAATARRSEPNVRGAPSTPDGSAVGVYWLLAFVLAIGGGIIWLMARKAK